MNAHLPAGSNIEWLRNTPTTLQRRWPPFPECGRKSKVVADMIEMVERFFRDDLLRERIFHVRDSRVAVHRAGPA